MKPVTVSRSPVSAAARLRRAASFVAPVLPKIEPSVGTNNSAITNDADSTAINVIGRYCMNSPITPGQSASGMNAASVVQVDAMIGHDMRIAARVYASLRDSPSAMRRSANSMTTIAPSTSMPTAMISANSTIMFIVIPKLPISRIPIRKLPGTATPTSNAERIPRMPIIIINTSSTEMSTLFWSSVSISFTSLALLRDATMLTSAGQYSRSAAMTSKTASTVSMTLAPARCTISIANAFSPFRRA